jgi:hypothetical protein
LTEDLIHNINFYNAELASVKAMLKEIENSGSWDHFLTGV